MTREEWIAAARAAVVEHVPGTVAWMRALLAWWDGRMDHALPHAKPARTDDPVEILNHGQAWCGAQAFAFAWLLRELGVPAEPLQLHGPEGLGHVVVQANLGPGSETTQGWAVIDPDHGHIWTSPDGKMAHPIELRAWPDWVAAERCAWKDANHPGVQEWEFWARGPRAINFQIGDVCNMHCTMCWQDLRRARQPRSAWHPEMSAQQVQEVLGRHAEEIDSVELVSFGEPMANPQFDEIVHAIYEMGEGRCRPFGLNVITNGSLLHLRRHMDVLRLPGYLTFSIDAADRGTYEAIREGGEWAVVARNLRAAVRHSGRHPERKVGINMTVFAPNLDGVFAMGALAAGLGLDYLSLLHGAGLERTRAAGQEIDRRDPQLLDQIDHIRESYPWLQLNDYATDRTLPALPAQTRPGRGFCPLPWRQFDVGPDGRAHPCCRSYGIDLGTPDEAWSGEPLRELRRQILADDVDPQRFGACAGCPNLGAGVRRRGLPVVS